MPTLIREPKVKAKTGLSHSTIWAKVAAGTFPKPIKLDPEGRAVAWVEEEIDGLINAAIARRDAAAAEAAA